MTDRQDLQDWLDDSESFVDNIPRPVPKLWGTRQFYETAIALGLTDEISITLTLVLIDRTERLYESLGGRVEYHVCAQEVLDQGLAAIHWKEGHTAYSQVRKSVWAWRRTIWTWRVKAFLYEDWNRLRSLFRHR